MRVPLSPEGDEEILEITVVRGRADESAARTQGMETTFGVGPWIVKVLDDFRADDQVEGCRIEIREDGIVGREQFKPALGISGAGVGDPLLAQVDPDNRASETEEFAAGVAVATPDIEDAGAGPDRTGQGHHFRHKMTVHVGGVGVGKAEVAVAGAAHDAGGVDCESGISLII